MRSAIASIATLLAFSALPRHAEANVMFATAFTILASSTLRISLKGGGIESSDCATCAKVGSTCVPGFGNYCVGECACREQHGGFYCEDCPAPAPTPPVVRYHCIDNTCVPASSGLSNKTCQSVCGHAAATPPCDPSAARKDCAQAVGGSEASCMAVGCCWAPLSPNPNNEPWCFLRQNGPNNVTLNPDPAVVSPAGGASTEVMSAAAIVDYAVKNPDLSTLAPPPPPPAPAPSLWFRGFNQIKESGQEDRVQCGEVDAASRMPDAIFDPILANEQALRAFEDITLALYGIYNDDGQTKDFGLELGRCADKNYTRFLRKADNVKWAPDELMSGICAKQCNCNFCLRPAPWCKAPQLPSCVDEPDDPKAGKWCSLCGPKYNKPITVNLFACGNPDETTCPGPDAQTPVADWARAGGASTEVMSAAAAAPGDCTYPTNCPNKVLPRADKQTWVMNKSTIIMPCNDTGFTDPKTTLGWGIVDFDWSNAKGTGTADGWVKHSPMDDEEMLFKQVQMTAAATPGTTVWVYRCSVYAYPWYTSVRALLDDPAYAPWFINFKTEGPWYSPKCDNNFTPPKCSDHYHMQEQSPGFPKGDGDCKAPGCDCGKAPCGFYLWNHSSTAVVHGQTFQEWFIHSYMLNKVGMSDLVSGFFWDDFWPAPGAGFPDASGGRVATDTGLALDDWGRITDAYHANMDALRETTLKAGKFAWQLLWTGGAETSVGGTDPRTQIVSKASCAANLRSMCNATAPPQTRAMMYTMGAGHYDPSKLSDLDVKQHLANFLLIRGPFAWLGHAWKGCSKNYPFPKEFNLDYGIPLEKVCKETAPNSGIFTREWSNANVSMDCSTWEPTIAWK